MRESRTITARKRCLVVHASGCEGRQTARTPAGRLAEAVGLARAIDLDVVKAEIVKLAVVHSSTLFGSGTVQRYAELMRACNTGGEPPIGVVIVDTTLTPVQQRNLEKAWNIKVVDRTGLILEIFGERARTAEGEMQVELAALTYQKSRLVRSWTHLERQRGGFGFVGGPGESQIETDRRLIGERIARLKCELKQIQRTRKLHRRARTRIPYPIVALVGYTNAGKSTLFNRLTQSQVAAEDQLFATLDPTMRALDLPSGRKAILSDTVGFISNLPYELIEAFRATLEEVISADLIVHVRDISHPETDEQKMDVEGVLRNLGLGQIVEFDGMIEVLNKIDLLSEDEQISLAKRVTRIHRLIVPLSAHTGNGCDEIIRIIDERLAAMMQVIEVRLAINDGVGLAWLYRHGEVLSRTGNHCAINLRVRLSQVDAARFARRELTSG